SVHCGWHSVPASMAGTRPAGRLVGSGTVGESWQLTRAIGARTRTARTGTRPYFIRFLLFPRPASLSEGGVIVARSLGLETASCTPLPTNLSFSRQQPLPLSGF